MKMKYFKLIFLLIICNHLQAQVIIEEEIQLYNDSISLPGTLSYPEKDSSMPLAIFIHGSGNVDRNGNQAGLPIQANYIKTLADSLNKNQIAFYRYDKRTANKANMPFINDSITFENLVKDAKICINHFTADNRFSTITIIGHSQGSLTGMLAVNDSISKLNDSIIRFVSLAGASKTFGETVVSQINKQSKELGAIAQEHLKELQETDTIQEVNFMLQQLFNPVNYNFIKSYNSYDPVLEIKKITVPTLILNGDADLQITPEDAQNLYAANPNSQLVIIPQMNHVLKTVKNLQENQLSYQSEEYPLSSELVSVLTKFIKK